MSAEKEKLEKYLETVFRERLRRQELVSRLREELVAYEQALHLSRSQWRFEARMMQAQESKRMKVSEELQKTKAALEEAILDLRRAQEREISVRQELDEEEE